MDIGIEKGSDFIVTDENGNSFIVERAVKREPKNTFIKKLFLSKKCNSDLVKKLTNNDLDVAQLKQIKNGYTKGLNDSQLENLINSEKSAEAMAEIVEIAVMINSRK